MELLALAVTLILTIGFGVLAARVLLNAMFALMTRPWVDGPAA